MAPIRAAILAALLTTVSQPVLAQGNAGAYLAARQAAFESDFRSAADYFGRALVRDTKNPDILQSALTAQLSLGDIDRAAPLARRMRSAGVEDQVANLSLYAALAGQGAWEEIIADLDAEHSVGPLFDGLLRAWALVGQGSMADALAQFDSVAETRGTQAFGLYHKALALASVGDFEGADNVFAGEDGDGLRLTRRGLIAHAQILGQLDRGSEGVALIEDAFGPEPDPAMADLRDRLRNAAPTPFTVVTTPKDGVAELHFTIAGAISGEAADGYTLLYARLVGYLRPDHIDGLLLTAGILEELENYDLATHVYDAVPLDDPSFHEAELGRAQSLRAAGRPDAAIEVLTQLGKSHGHLPVVHIALGDFLRSLERYGDAAASYDRAIPLIGEAQPSHWSLYFSRGISFEREDRWDEAEADFRRALELQPEQPQVLNYLGYSFVELNRNLEEALDMIERAVEGQPNSGYITDSLGWVLYRLGRYDEAVEHMERAVELLPIDPVVNDHLGDVYWAVGRIREAEFQWSRALSFIEPEESTDADPERIRRKLEIGLDGVLAEEGAPPLQVANDGG
ncbi:MAG: tetratricopeptide repeat protein [Pseudomonadota bacterium]